MVAATVVTVGAVISAVGTGGTIAVTVGAAAAEGVVIGVVTSVTNAGATTAASGAASAAGTAATAGAITGAGVGGGSTTTSLIGAAVAGTAATGVTATSVGMAATVNAAVVGGPALWIVLGADFNDRTNEHNLSYDCWKPLLHDTSIHPSKGILLRDVLLDPRIKDVDVSYDLGATYPQIKLQNIWGENFKIEYVRLPWEEIAAHAVRL